MSTAPAIRAWSRHVPLYARIAVRLGKSNIPFYLFFAACLLLSIFVLVDYPGRWYVYLLFSIVLNALLFLGMRKDSLFFDLFIGGLFWLGYWLKFSIRMAFLDGNFVGKLGYFDYSGDDFDHALIVVSCGVSGLLLARVLRARYWFSYPGTGAEIGLSGLCAFYERHRLSIWIAFLVLVVAISASNAFLGIYQRGLAPRINLPYKLGGVFTWILLFGAAMLSALMLNFELKLHRAIPLALVLIVLFETFASNVSMLSRGMILNASVLIMGTYVVVRRERIGLAPRLVGTTLTALVCLFLISLLIVNYLRLDEYYESYLSRAHEETASVPSAEKLAPYTSILLLDRWVGIEGAMAVSSYPNLEWDLLHDAWTERFSHYGTSMYDIEIAKSVTKQDQAFMKEHGQHFISMPGILSFFYYPASYVFLFAAMFLAGAFAAGIEVATFKLAGYNLILCSLVAFTVAYRYAHFGYAPSRSYLLFGAIAASIALIYLADRLITRWVGSSRRG